MNATKEIADKRDSLDIVDDMKRHCNFILAITETFISMENGPEPWTVGPIIGEVDSRIGEIDQAFNTLWGRLREYETADKEKEEAAEREAREKRLDTVTDDFLNKMKNMVKYLEEKKARQERGEEA